MNKNWVQYWNKKNRALNSLMLNSTTIFYENYKNKFPINNKSTYLDFGCGNGVFVDCIKNECKTIIGVDSSPTYIRKCKQSHYGNKKIYFYLISDFDDFLNILLKFKIDFVIVNSVIQYFKDERDIVLFLDKIHQASIIKNNKITVIISDILGTNHFMLNDLIDILKNAIKKKSLNNFFLFIIGNLFDIICKKRGRLLSVDYSFFKNYANSNKLTVNKNDNLGIHKTRYSVEITFIPKYDHLS